MNALLLTEFLGDSVVPERNVPEKWGTHRERTKGNSANRPRGLRRRNKRIAAEISNF